MESVRESADASMHGAIDSIKSTAGYSTNGEVKQMVFVMFNLYGYAVI